MYLKIFYFLYSVWGVPLSGCRVRISKSNIFRKSRKKTEFENMPVLMANKIAMKFFEDVINIVKNIAFSLLNKPDSAENIYFWFEIAASTTTIIIITKTAYASRSFSQSQPIYLSITSKWIENHASCSWKLFGQIEWNSHTDCVCTFSPIFILFLFFFHSHS